ncbi:MAG: PQQ-binding-like beta-propeller repeat protein [Pseudorhodoplanes sp.]
MHKSLLTAFVLLAIDAAPASAQTPWQTFNGDLKAQKFSPLTEITPANVKNLKLVWRTRTGDVSPGAGPRGMPMGEPRKPPATMWSATPLFVNDTVYLGTPFYRIFALEPDTGKVKWIYDTKSVLDPVTQPDLKTRGVAYWQADKIVPGEPCQKRVYIGTMNAKLHAVDADTGKPCADFGENGIVDVDQWNVVNRKWPLALIQPPTVFKDFLFLGWSSKDWAEAESPPGSVFALDARTGALRWTFETIPEDIAAKTGGGNVFASMSIDAEKNLLFIPVGSPSPHFFGGNRLDVIPNATSITALDIDTGKEVWTRQLVHHDLWNYDTNSAPTLIDIVKDGVTIPALVQTSKQGFLYVLNRHSGEPIYPMEERGVPKSAVPGEVSSPTQPFVSVPPPTTDEKWPGVFDLADWLGFRYCSRTASRLKYEGRFTPPSLEGTLVYPALIGGVEWGGGAVDPASQTFVVNSSNVVQLYRLMRRADYNNAVPDIEHDGFFPMNGSPYGIRLRNFLNSIGMPCWNPPYGTLSSYDLKTGKLLWRKPFGQVQQWGFYMPEAWGSVTIGAPVITAGGLIFIGASMDSRVRAVDLKTGEVLWKHVVPAPAAAMPAVYQHKGKQYVVFVAGGDSVLSAKTSDEVVAFALP